MREAKCPGDQKFNSAPMPCGTYMLGNANIQCMFFVLFIFKLFISLSFIDHRNIGYLISFGLTIIIFIVFDF